MLAYTPHAFANTRHDDVRMLKASGTSSIVHRTNNTIPLVQRNHSAFGYVILRPLNKQDLRGSAVFFPDE